jgi:hypothetical protein
VLEDESYVGESMLDTMKPDEERLVPYSVELGCVISVDPRSERKDVHYAQISNGTLFLYRYRIERKVYVIQNKSDRKLDLFLEHRFLPGWELVESEKPVERTDSFYRFRTEVPAKKTVKFTVSEKGDESESHGIQSVGRDQLKVWLESKFIDMKTLGVLQAVLDLNDKAAALTRRLQEREREIAELFQNQERLRKNLQALGSTRDEGGLRERYVSELAAEEDKLAADRADIKKTREEKAKVEEDLRARLGKLKYEATL